MVIAGPNPTVDRLISLDRFDPGHIHRAAQVETRIGGGGVNAARVISQLGATSTLVTVLPTGDEREVAYGLGREGVTLKWIPSSGHVRLATILREQDGRMSVLHEPGAAIDPREWEEFARTVAGHLRSGQILLCSGSLPPGAPSDGYARLAREARHLGARCVVDAAGETLAAIIEAREALIVPNLAEAEGVLRGSRSHPVHPQDAPERARAAAVELLGRGAHKAVVTAGGAGAAFAEQGHRGGSGWVPAPPVEPRSPIGAGDAFAAALSLRLEAGADLEQAVGYAVAVAAAHVESGDGTIRAERIAELRCGAARR